MPIDVELLLNCIGLKKGYGIAAMQTIKYGRNAGALRRIAGRLCSEVTGGIKKYYFLCCFISSDSVNIAIKCAMNITAQISFGGTTTYKCAYLLFNFIRFLGTWLLSSTGWDLRRHLRSVSRSGQQCMCWFSGSNS